MQSYNIYTCPVGEDSSGDLILEFPDEMMDAMGWKVGDTLVWEPMLNGAWSLKKVDKDGGSNDKK
jgi:uncharacterized membrane protein (UPF0127 family)